MGKDETWHGIPRRDIPWFPTVDADACIGCSLCYTTCGRGVHEMRDNKAVPVNAMSCMVGCNANISSSESSVGVPTVMQPKGKCLFVAERKP